MQACPDLWAHIDLARGRRCRPSDAALARSAPRWHRLRSLSLAGVAGVGDAGLQVCFGRGGVQCDGMLD